jgi:hypothetical protein
MKTKIIVIICSVFFLISCDVSIEPEEYDGFSIDIANDDVVLRNAKLTIGGIKDGNFIGTESFSLPVINVRENMSQSQNIAFNETRWLPNLNLIRAISNKAYFTLDIEGKSPVPLSDSWGERKGELLSFAIPIGIIINRRNANLGINIAKDSLSAHIAGW